MVDQAEQQSVHLLAIVRQKVGEVFLFQGVIGIVRQLLVNNRGYQEEV